MDLSSAPHLQAMVAQSLEDVLACPKPQQDKKARPQQEQALKCPRCDSINTKFCYYNNYSLSQPRYFCKGCKRYWTQGGTLRNVPVGGGCRKNNKRSSSSSSSSSSSKRTQDQVLITTNSNQIPTLPLLTYDSNDLTLAFARLHNNQPTMQLGLNDHDLSLLGNTSTNQHCGILGNQNTTMTNNNTPNSTFLDALKSGFLDTHGGSHSIYNNGYGNEDLGEVLSGSAGGEEGLVLPYEEMSGSTTMTTTKQEFCRVRDGESRIFMNFPWQIGGDQANIGGAESGRDYWNGLGSSWHGVVNSPLM